jgi:hypothetical protein
MCAGVEKTWMVQTALPDVCVWPDVYISQTSGNAGDNTSQHELH